MFLRSVLVRFFFFTLISIGQAYPLSLAWSLTPHKQACCCSDAKPTCECDETHHSGASQKIKGCHSDKRAGYAPVPCGKQSPDTVGNVQWERFLPATAQNIFFIPHQRVVIQNSHFVSGFALPPEGPPPKVSFAS